MSVSTTVRTRTAAEQVAALNTEFQAAVKRNDVTAMDAILADAQGSAY
ncbi:MAG: hypothetical protein M3Z30_11770 [Gemmatimonadota bacterium]|nr:hypothetical protein [Gemmatimonadota bacterium]